MKISVADVRRVFLDVLSKALSREAAGRWAYELIQLSETGELEFFPISDKERIWSGIMYLYGVDLRESPSEYLHSEEDIRNAMFQKLGDEEGG